MRPSAKEGGEVKASAAAGPEGGGQGELELTDVCFILRERLDDERLGASVVALVVVPLSLLKTARSNVQA